MRPALGAVSDRTLNRAIIGLGLALVIGLPTVGLLYVVDRNVDPGPPMTQRAVDAAEAAIRNEPNKLSNRLRLAEAYVAADRQADAITQFTEILRVEPTNRGALIGRGDAYTATGDLDAAVRDYQALVDAASGEEMANVDPSLETAYYALGSIALKQGRPADATTMLEKALRINRTDADALTLMGTALLATGDTGSAVDVLRRAIALVPSGWREPYAELAKAYTAQGDEAGARYAEGMVALCDKRYLEAGEDLKPLVDGAYGRDALIGLGLLAEATGDEQAGVAYYSRVYAADPRDFDAITGLNRLGASPAIQSPPVVVSTPSGGTSQGN